LSAALELGAQTTVVLPLFNLTEDANLDWIGEGAAETVREALAAEGFLVLDRRSREEAYRRLSLRPHAVLTRASVVKLGKMLDAERVIHGTFEISAPPGPDSSIRLAIRVLDLGELSLSAEESASASLEDLADAQARLAWQVIRLLAAPGAAPAEEEYLRRHKRVRLDALESYSRGLMATTPEQKHRFLTQAARLDEGFSLPCFELGRLLVGSNDYKAAAGWFERVPPDSPDYLEAQFYLGLSRYNLGQYDQAVASFRTVVDAAPLSEVWNNLGAAQSRKNLPEAAESFRKASEGDPKDASYLFNLGYVLWKLGEFEAATAKFRASLDLSPEDPEAILMLGRSLKGTPVRETQQRVAGLERIKANLEEQACRELRAALARRK